MNTSAMIAKRKLLSGRLFATHVCTKRRKGIIGFHFGNMTKNIEHYAVSLPLATRMRELGFPQDSFFYHWQNVSTDKYYKIREFKSMEMLNTSAYTVGELYDFLKHPSQSIMSFDMYSHAVWRGSVWAIYDEGKLLHSNEIQDVL